MTKGMRFLLAAALLFAMALPGLADEYKYTMDETYSMAPDGTLFLDTDDADVTIIGSDREDVHIKVFHVWDVSGVSSVENTDFSIEVVEADGDLRVSEYSEGSFNLFFGSIRERYEVEIEAPHGINLRLRGDDDDYRIRNFAGDVRLDFEDGDAVLREMTGTHFEFGVEDGDIDMVGGTGVLDVYVEDGSVVIEEGAFEDVNVDTEDGDVLLATSLSDGGRYRMDAEDGDIELQVTGGGGEFHVFFEDGRARASNKFEMIEEDENFMELKLPGGTANVRLEVQDGRITLRTK